jgi:hypothetical protein
VKRGAILLLVLTASLALSATPAAAKGNIPTRTYAVVTGPGLPHPIVFTAPWKDSRGGFYTGEGELFLGLAGGTGALPAGRLKIGPGNYVPDGVLPIDEVPTQGARGPRYRLTWFRDGVEEVAKQNIYPYAGFPLVYTFPSSRQALIVLFGRFQSPAHLWTGWGEATSFDLNTTLQFYGLPSVEPEVRADQGDAPSTSVATHAPSTAPVTGAVVPARHSGSAPAVVLSVAILLAILATTFLWMRRRSRKTDAVSEVGA